MIRTRDVVLYILVVWFLLLAISVTVWRDTSTASSQSAPLATLETATTTPTSLPAVFTGATANEPDREATRDRLRAKITAGEVISNPSPSVPAPEREEVREVPATKLQRCAYPDDSLGFVSRWPAQSIQTESREGARLYYTEDFVSPPTIGTSTATTESETMRISWLQLPQFPQPLPTPACVPSEVVGVSVSGTLLFNTSVILYQTATADTLIGYARDGYPIYGRYDGEVDECGGYRHPTGYRYVIQADTETIIQCFTATPQSIQW